MGMNLLCNMCKISLSFQIWCIGIHSVMMITHTGAKLQDMFSESQQGAACSFKEPPETGGKYRWQIIHLKEKEPMKKPADVETSGSNDSNDVLVLKEKGELQ